MQRQFDTAGIDQLSYQKLFEIAQQKFNELDYEEAQYYYAAAYKKKPHQDMIVLCYSHVLKQNDKIQQAKNILQASLNNNAAGTYKRYFQLAQIYHGQQSITIFQKGIQQAVACINNPFLNNAPANQIKRDIAQAYASIAQICMTDLSHLPYEQVQAKCISVLQRGKQADPNCMDIHLQMANCLIQKDQYQQANKQLKIIKDTFINQKQQLEDQLVLQCAKYFMQIKQHEQSIEILEKLNQSQNNSPQIVYLLAFCAYQMKKYQLCKQYINQYPENQTQDLQVEEAMKQLKIQLSKNSKFNDETEQGMADQWEDIDEEIQG